MPSGLGVLPRQNLSHAIRRHLLFPASVVSALDQRQPHFPLCTPCSVWFRCQASPEEVGDDVLQPAALVRRPDLRGAHQLIGKIEGRFQRGPEYREAGFMGQTPTAARGCRQAP